MGAKLHRLPSMSQSALLLSPCIRWAGQEMPWYREDRLDSEDLKKRDDGTLTHRAVDTEHKTGQAIPGLPDNVSRMAWHCGRYLREVLGPLSVSVTTEVACGCNWLTGETRVFPEVADRNYPTGPEWDGWQFGTADVVARLLTGQLWVGDWKTGGTDGAREQLMSLAWAIASCEPTPPKSVVIACLPVNEDGVWPHEEELSWEELSSHRMAMSFQWEDIGVRTTASPGVHCTALYCPHLAYCPAIGGVVTDLSKKAGPGGQEPEVAEKEMSLYQVTDQPTSDTEAGFTQAMVAAANRRIKYLTACNKQRVKDGDKVVFGNYVWEERGNGYRWYKN